MASFQCWQIKVLKSLFLATLLRLSPFLGVLVKNIKKNEKICVQISLEKTYIISVMTYFIVIWFV